MKDSTARYYERTRDFRNSLVLVLPVMIFYQIAIIPNANAINGVDFIFRFFVYFFKNKPYAIWLYLAFTGFLVLLMIVLAWIFGRKNRFTWDYVPPLIAECTLYAVVLGAAAVVITRWVVEAQPRVATAAHHEGPFTILVISAGAGVYEEIVFRLAIFGGLVRLFRKGLKATRPAAVLVGVIASAALFSLAHYMGREEMTLANFTFRFVAGAIFCLLFEARGFAAAVYTHTIYDIIVLFLSPGR